MQFYERLLAYLFPFAYLLSPFAERVVFHPSSYKSFLKLFLLEFDISAFSLIKNLPPRRGFFPPIPVSRPVFRPPFAASPPHHRSANILEGKNFLRPPLFRLLPSRRYTVVANVE